jgi:Protein of unknown function (DUF3072)
MAADGAVPNSAPNTVPNPGSDDGSEPVTPRPERPRDQWVTGDEPMTGPQQSYLATLAQEAGEEVPAELTKAQASEHIDRLQQQTGRGR